MASFSASSSATTLSNSDGLDIAKRLVQKIVRTFYGTRAAILADQLVLKECFRDEELARRLGMQIKDVTKIAHRLVEDQIVQVHRRSEMRENGMMKAQQRAYYYLDFSKAIDVIKWRMWRIQQTIDVKLRNELDAQGYVCPLCKASYTPLDAASLFDPMTNMFRCTVCQSEVINNENEEEVRGNKDRMQRLNRQTKGIVDLLKQMDKVTLPRFDIEAYLARYGPALGATAAAAAGGNSFSASGGAAAVVKVQLAGDDDEARELGRREREAETKRAQNALPSWIAQSTISSAPEREGSAGGGDGDGGGGAVGAATFGTSSAARVGGATLRMGDYGDDGDEAKRVRTANNGYAAAGALGSDPPGGGGGAADEASQDADLDAYYARLENDAAMAGAATVTSTTTPTTLGGVTPQAAEEDGDEVEADEDEGASPLLDSPGVSTPGVGPGPVVEADEEGDTGVLGPKRVREAGEEDEYETSKRARRDDGPMAAAAATSSAGDEATGQLGAAGGGGGEAAVEAENHDLEDLEEEEEDDDDFNLDGDGADADPNQLILVNGKEVPFVEVTEEMTGDMTADEYSAYWEVYQRVNA